MGATVEDFPPEFTTADGLDDAPADIGDGVDGPSYAPDAPDGSEVVEAVAELVDGPLDGPLGASAALARVPLAALAVPRSTTDKVLAYSRRSPQSPATRRAYATSWAQYVAWCDKRGLAALPSPGGEPNVEQVGVYIVEVGEGRIAERRGVASVLRAVASIVDAHKAAGFRLDRRDPRIQGSIDNLTAQAVEAGYEPHPKDAITLAEMDALRPHLSVAEWSFVTLGWFTGLRRSNISALDRRHITFVPADTERPEQLRVVVDKSKTDQLRKGRIVFAAAQGKDEPICAVNAMRAYLEQRGDDDGPLYAGLSGGRLPDKVITLTIQAAATAAGLPKERFGAHSLRAGLVTSGVQSGRELPEVMKQSDHRTYSVAMKYDRPKIENNITAGLVARLRARAAAKGSR